MLVLAAGTASLTPRLREVLILTTSGNWANLSCAAFRAPIRDHSAPVSVLAVRMCHFLSPSCISSQSDSSVSDLLTRIRDPALANVDKAASDLKWHCACDSAARRFLPMTPSRVFAVCATLLVLGTTLLVLGTPLTAGAEPGDPRLVSGVLEWPVVATSTPFVIIRGDNGVLYYVSVAAARRAGAVKAGARVSVLGIEGPNVHEIRAVGMGSGPTAEAALADLQAAPGPQAVAPAPAGDTPVAAATAPGAPGPAGVAPAPVATTPTTAASSPVPT